MKSFQEYLTEAASPRFTFKNFRRALDQKLRKTKVAGAADNFFWGFREIPGDDKDCAYLFMMGQNEKGEAYGAADKDATKGKPGDVTGVSICLSGNDTIWLDFRKVNDKIVSKKDRDLLKAAVEDVAGTFGKEVDVKEKQ